MWCRCGITVRLLYVRCRHRYDHQSVGGQHLSRQFRLAAFNHSFVHTAQPYSSHLYTISCVHFSMHIAHPHHIRTYVHLEKDRKRKHNAHVLHHQHKCEQIYAIWITVFGVLLLLLCVLFCGKLKRLKKVAAIYFFRVFTLYMYGGFIFFFIVHFVLCVWY